MRNSTPLPESFCPIIRQVLELCYADPRTGEEIEAVAGVGHGKLSQWRCRRGGGTIVTVQSVLGALGYELKIVPIEKE